MLIVVFDGERQQNCKTSCGTAEPRRSCVALLEIGKEACGGTVSSSFNDLCTRTASKRRFACPLRAECARAFTPRRCCSTFDSWVGVEMRNKNWSFADMSSHE